MKTVTLRKLVMILTVIVAAISFSLATTGKEASAKTLEVNHGKAISLKVAEKKTVRATGTRKASFTLSAKKYKDKSTKVATLSNEKSRTVRITAKRSGVCYLKAKANGKTAVCKIRVTKAGSNTARANALVRTTGTTGVQLMYYSEEDLDLLARVIYGEAGCSWCSDAEQLAVGSVVLNRVKCDLYPDTIYDVVYQKGQYACVHSSAFRGKIPKRCYDNARFLLENGSVLPANVVFQAQFRQGSGTYVKIGVHYFCYTNKIAA